jgi:glycosyltransferase involved in cell wall biosynthesis
VASAVGGIPRLGDHAVELVAPQHADALAAAVRRVLDDPARRAGMVSAGRELVDRRFSSARMRSDYEAVYEIVRKGSRSS